MPTRESDKSTYLLVFTAFMACLTLLGTILLRIPVPMTQGYVHLGDAMIFLSVLLLGKKHGAIAAALGSALGDLLGGFGFWIPWTFAIKFAMAFVTGHLIETIDCAQSNSSQKKALAMTIGGIIMCAGYLVAERIMYGSWALAAISIPWNIGQFAVGIAVASVAYPLVKKQI